MLIKVKVYPNSKRQEISQNKEDSYEVWVKAPAIAGQANREAIQVLADYFKIPLNQTRLVRGFKEQNKLFEIKKQEDF